MAKTTFWTFKRIKDVKCHLGKPFRREIKRFAEIWMIFHSCCKQIGRRKAYTCAFLNFCVKREDWKGRFDISNRCRNVSSLRLSRDRMHKSFSLMLQLKIAVSSLATGCTRRQRVGAVFPAAACMLVRSDIYYLAQTRWRDRTVNGSARSFARARAWRE